MVKEKQSRGRSLERIFLLMIAIVMSLLFLDLFTVLKRDFKDVPQRLRDGSMVNLNEANPDERFRYLLQRGYYLDDIRDIELIRSVVAQRLNTSEENIDNIGELNKSKYNVNADEAFSQGGESFRKRVIASRSLLGYSGADSALFFRERTSPVKLNAINNAALGSYSITTNLSEKPVNNMSTGSIN